MTNPRTRGHQSARFCPIWSVWNCTTNEWATHTGFSTEAEAAKVALVARRTALQCPVDNKNAYEARIREEYSLMTLKSAEKAEHRQHI